MPEKNAAPSAMRAHRAAHRSQSRRPRLSLFSLACMGPLVPAALLSTALRNGRHAKLCLMIAEKIGDELGRRRSTGIPRYHVNSVSRFEKALPHAEDGLRLALHFRADCPRYYV